jgi:hypothetical protein
MEQADDFDCAAASAEAFASHMATKHLAVDALQRIALALEMIASTLDQMVTQEGASHE